MLHNPNWLPPGPEFEDGTSALGLTNESIARRLLGHVDALFHRAVHLLDRFGREPRHLLLTLGWGACASTWFSIHVNTGWVPP